MTLYVQVGSESLSDIAHHQLRYPSMKDNKKWVSEATYQNSDRNSNENRRQCGFPITGVGFDNK